ncbi:MAG: hypothetical protein ACPGVB_08110 [Chitinophagales bacterium]
MAGNKSFSEWSQIEVEKQFGIQQVFENATLEEWINASDTISEFEMDTIEPLRAKAQMYIYVWNEADYTANFISNIFSLVDFNQFRYSTFYEQPVEVSMGDYLVKGRIDLMIAKGRGIPEKPYFFMQEFKQEKGSGDAIAQVLLAMIYAQKQNEGKLPIYGGYINGRNWFFIILEDNKYTISETFIATKKEDLLQIVRILKYLKKQIEVYPQ